MSTAGQRNGALKVALEDDMESCPICKSDRYLVRDIRFLVNPECYHKMCESCVDRVFAHGPNACPVAGCNKTLRRHGFRIPTFHDLHLEREVDIRKKVAKVFNREEQDFDSLKTYNDYLNDVEDIIFNLIEKIDVEATEKKLRDYEAVNRQAISENLQRSKHGAKTAQARQAAEREAVKVRRMAALREEEEARREREEEKRDLVARLASGEGDAEELAKRSQRIMIKKAQSRKEAMQNGRTSLDNANGSADFMIKGLKKHVEEEPEKPYDPFGGMSTKRDFFVMQEDYDWDFFDNLKTEPKYFAGGYDVREYCNRALCEAFSGLGVLIGETSAGAASSSASIVAAKMAHDDVF